MKAREFICTVQGKRMLTPTVFELTFDTNEPVEFKAGQFVSVVVPGAGPKGRDLRRAYSIASAPQIRPIELCVKLVDGGPGTNYLYGLKPGDSFKGWAPYGDFVYEPKDERGAAFISTGTGIAPFRSMVFSPEYQARPPKSLLCLFGVRSESEMLYDKEMSEVEGLRWISAVTQPADGFKGYKGRVTDYLRGLGDDFPWLQTDYYLCGNGEMIKEVLELLTSRGVDKESIHKEKYY